MDVWIYLDMPMNMFVYRETHIYVYREKIDMYVYI